MWNRIGPTLTENKKALIFSYTINYDINEFIPFNVKQQLLTVGQILVCNRSSLFYAIYLILILIFKHMKCPLHCTFPIERNKVN